MSIRYGRKNTRIPARRTRVTFRARTPSEGRRIIFLVKRRRKNCLK